MDNINKNNKNNLPFKESVDGDFVIRTFSDSLNESELIWHRDKEDRVIFPLHESDWKIQLDNDIPRPLSPESPIIIESKQFHRLIKGSGILEVKIYKTDLSNDKKVLRKIISETLSLFLEKSGDDSRTKKGRKVPGKYLTSKSKKKRSQMKKEIDKFAHKKSSDSSAYTKQWKADKGEKTKKSAATLAYQKMYGERFEVLKDKKSKLIQSFNNFKEIASREKKETAEAFKICKKLLAKKEVSEEELEFLKEQSKDLAKIFGVMAMGSVSMAIPIALEKVLNKKYGISIMPKSQEPLSESKKNDKGLKKKSKDSNIPYYILKQVYNRGMAAWRTGHRPGVAQNQWAMGRVNSFITGSGGARKADADLWSKAKKAKAKKKGKK
jgi:hypothetical protein